MEGRSRKGDATSEMGAGDERRAPGGRRADETSRRTLVYAGSLAEIGHSRHGARIRGTRDHQLYGYYRLALELPSQSVGSGTMTGLSNYNVHNDVVHRCGVCSGQSIDRM